MGYLQTARKVIYFQLVVNRSSTPKEMGHYVFFCFDVSVITNWIVCRGGHIRSSYRINSRIDNIRIYVFGSEE